MIEIIEACGNCGAEGMVNGNCGLCETCLKTVSKLIIVPADDITIEDINELVETIVKEHKHLVKDVYLEV